MLSDSVYISFSKELKNFLLWYIFISIIIFFLDGRVEKIECGYLEPVTYNLPEKTNWSSLVVRIMFGLSRL